MLATSIQINSDSLSQLIALGYEAALSRPAWRLFAEDVATASGSQMAMIQHVEDDHPERSFLVCGGLGNEFEEVFAKTCWLSEDDHFWNDIRQRPSGTVRLSQDIVAREVMRKSPDYARVALPWKLEHFLIGAIATGNGTSTILSLGRTAKQSPFVAGDKALLNPTLLAHLRRSFVLQREFDAVRQTNSMLSAVFDLTPYGLVVFDARGRPVTVNQRAATIFGLSEGLTLINSRLHAADPAAHASLERALSMALQGALGMLIAPPDPVMVPRKNHSSPYQVLFTQLMLRDNSEGFSTKAAVVAMIHDGWVGDTKYNPMILSSRYGLTRAEIRLCQAMLEHHTLLDAANALHISLNTAKTHLTRIYSKTNIHSRAALLHLLSAVSQPKITNP